MEVYTTIEDLKRGVKCCKSKGKKVGFVPTMGFLHEGHLSLIRRAREENDIVVVSIFVNPTQFGPNEDLNKYPRDFDRDKKLLEQEKIDFLFCPSVEEMYPNDKDNDFVEVEELGQKLCGKSRPTHFRGVATVVKKLFDIVEPDRAYFGKKDYQQYVILKKMVKDLKMSVEIIGCPIVREKDGLAMSSRNSYLSTQERSAALVLVNALNLAKEYIENPKYQVPMTNRLISNIEDFIRKESLARIDYVEIVDSETLDPVETVEKWNLVALAVYIGKTRLIDNLVVGDPATPSVASQGKEGIG